MKGTALQADTICKEYGDPLLSLGYDVGGLIAFSLEYDKKKVSAAYRKQYLAELVPVLKDLGIKRIIVCDSDYFKTMAKVQKVTGCNGYVYEYEGMDMVMGYNHQQFFFKPEVRDDLLLSLTALVAHSNGVYEELGKDVLRHAYYPETVQQIADELNRLHQYESLTCDIEAFSLKHYTCGLGTISFAWSQHEGTAFLVDWQELNEPVNVKNSAGHKTKKWIYGEERVNHAVRVLLKQFFEEYEGTLIYHNISYDGYALAYQLWMTDLLDQKGLLEGLEIMTRKFHCTKLITYLATNTCSGNTLGLKPQSHEFTGNYAEEDVKDIRLIPKGKLLKYNLIDTCATWFVMDKHYDTLVLDDQLDIYENVFIPAVKDIIQMQLTGMCLDMPKVLSAEKKLSLIRKKAMNTIHSMQITQQFVRDKRTAELHYRNAEYKTKVITMDDVLFEFNPNSNPQMQEFLYEYMGLPIIDRTKSKQPACGGDTLAKLVNHTTDKLYKAILLALIDFALVDKVLGTFIKAFKEAPLANDGYHYLYGAFNLGGTVSGRLSSSNPKPYWGYKTFRIQGNPRTGNPELNNPYLLRSTRWIIRLNSILKIQNLPYKLLRIHLVSATKSFIGFGAHIHQRTVKHVKLRTTHALRWDVITQC